MPIDSKTQLREHLELAIQVELATVPTYLYAMYSIADPTSEAALLIRSIVAEEMLHAALGANLLLAVGGEPRFHTTEWIPTYPGLVPHHEPPLMLTLEPASSHTIRDVFMRIEQPEVHGAPAEPDVFETLGQFYHALEIAFEELSQDGNLFDNVQADRQMGDPSFYAPVEYDADDSGGLMLVNDFASASEAIEVIVHQGEGLSTDRWADPEHRELTHYHKLLQIAEGQSPLGVVLPVPTNPQQADYPEPVRIVAELFNAAYRHTFLVMAEIFSANADKGASVGRLYSLMSRVLSPLARHLTATSIGENQVAAPTFEVHDFDGDPAAELIEMAQTVAASEPTLAPVAATVESLM